VRELGEFCTSGGCSGVASSVVMNLVAGGLSGVLLIVFLGASLLENAER